MNEPNVIIQGITYEWQEQAALNQVNGWTLTYYLGGVTSSVIPTNTALPAAAGFDVTMSSAFTNTLPVGNYSLAGILNNATSGEVFYYSTTVCQVQANPTTIPVNTDTRSFNQQQLDLINTALQNIVADGVVSLSIAGRHRQNYTVKELLTLKSYWAAQVEAENVANRISKGKTGKSQIYVRFQPVT